MTDKSEKMEYNPMSGWVKKGGVRQGREFAIGRAIYMKVPDYKGLPASQRVLEEKWIWKKVTGHDPDGEIIHLNGDVHDNRWKNLRTKNQMLVEAGKDCLEMCHIEWRFRNQQKQLDLDYRRETGEIVSLGRGESVIKMSDDRPVIFWAGQWFSAEDVAYFLATGVWPERGVVMANGQFCDLRLCNLRRCV